MTKPLAVQLYTFRDLDRPGPEGLGLDPATLEAIAEIGYLGVETVDIPGGDAVAARRTLDEVGLRVTSSHSWARPDDLEGFGRAAAGIAELGSSSIIVSSGKLGTTADIAAFADRLNAAAIVARTHGLTLALHNHSAEMQLVEGVTAYHRLRERLDHDIRFQVDIFWVQVGGADPVSVIRDLGDRVVSLHVKDGAVLPAEAGDEPFVNVPIGEGVVDVASAVAAADPYPGIEWAIVEFDYCDGPPIDAVRASFAWMVEHGLGRGARP